MAATPTEHRAKIAEARNVLGEVIARARFGGEPTILINRGKEAAVIVSHPSYEQAKVDRKLVELLSERNPELHEELLAEVAPKPKKKVVVRRSKPASDS